MKRLKKLILILILRKDFLIKDFCKWISWVIKRCRNVSTILLRDCSYCSLHDILLSFYLAPKVPIIMSSRLLFIFCIVWFTVSRFQHSRELFYRSRHVQWPCEARTPRFSGFCLVLYIIAIIQWLYNLIIPYIDNFYMTNTNVRRYLTEQRFNWRGIGMVQQGATRYQVGVTFGCRPYCLHISLG